MKPLKSTTAILMSVSLVFPNVSFAQDNGAGGAQCQDDQTPPCLTASGDLLLPSTDGLGELQQCDGTENLPCLTDQGFALVQCASDEAPQEILDTCVGLEQTAVVGEAAESSAEPETDTVAAPSEQDAAEEIADDATEESSGATQDQEVTSDAEAVQTAPSDDTAEQSDPPIDENAAAEVTDEPDGEEKADDAPATDADAPEGEATAEMADTEDATDAQPEAASDKNAEEMTAPETDQSASDEGAPDGNAEADVATSADGQVDAESSAEAETAATAKADAAPDAPVENPEITADVETGVVEVEEATVGAAAAEALETDGDVAEGVQVEEEAVTEETARAATEDFETSASGEAAETGASQDGGGLSKFEQALMLGLGAVVVGSILNNGDEVVSNSGDRVVVKSDTGGLRVLKDDDALLRQPGSRVRTETFSDGSTRTTVTKESGSRIVTLRASDGRVVRRERIFPDGVRFVLFDDTQTSEPVDLADLPDFSERPAARSFDASDEEALRLALAAELQSSVERDYSLRQIRQIRKVRELAPEIELDAVTFRSGSAAIDPTQASELAALGRAMVRVIEDRPAEVFLIEGHTDAVGSASLNLALSDRRAETVALALTEFFDVPPENMITQGYGESYLKVPTLTDERANRRVTVRRITPLLRQAASNR